MLKRSTVLKWGEMLNLISNWNVLPLVWNSETLEFTCTESRRKLNMWRSIVLIHFAYVGFLAFRFFYGIFYLDLPGSRHAFHLIWSTTFVLSACSHLNLLLRREVIASYLTHLVWINLNWRQGCDANDRTARLIFCGILGSAFAHVPLGLIALLIDPMQPQFLTSVILPWTACTKYSLIIALALTFETFLLLEHWVNMLLQAFIHLVHLQTSILSLRDIRASLAFNPTRHFLHRFRWVQLLHSAYVQVSAKEFLCGFELAVLYASIVTNFAAMKFHSSASTPVHIYILFPLGTLLSSAYQYLMHSKAALVYKTSRQIHVLKRREILENGLLYRYQRSCRPMMVRVGTIMRFKNLTPLKFFNFIVIWTAKLYFYTDK